MTGLDGLLRIRRRIEEAYPALLSLLDSLELGFSVAMNGIVVLSNSVANSCAGVASLDGAALASLVAEHESPLLEARLSETMACQRSIGTHRFVARNPVFAHQVDLEVVLLPVGLEGPPAMLLLISIAVPAMPRTELEFERAFEDSHDAILVVTRDGRVRRANAAASALLGYSSKDFEGLEVERLLPQEQRAGHAAVRRNYTASPVARAMRGPSTMFAVSRLGRFVPVEIALTPLTVGGEPVIIVLLRERASRFDRSRALRESEVRHRRMFEAASDGIFICDQTGKYVDVNPAGCALLRGSREAILGKSLTDIVAPADLERQPLQLELVGGGATFERTLRRFDGTNVAVEISGSMLPGGLIQGIVRDLSERRLTEEARREAAKMEAVGRLAGGVAHDFNNMLTVVLSLTAELRARVGDDAGAMELVEDLTATGLRAAELTKQLLSFARRQPVHATLVDVNDELRGLARFLSRALGDTIEVKMELAATLPHVRFDRAQLEQCVVNLAVNARDAMASGGVLRISTSTADGGVVLEVEDSGVGMDQDTLDHCFEPFFTTKAVGKGTGLGLATVYGIITGATGKLTVRTFPGRGTTFRIWLPSTSQESSPRARGNACPEPSSVEGRGVVLLVEDDEAVRHAVHSNLSSAGYVVRSVGALEDALVVARGTPVLDLLVTDVLMPRASGLDVATALRALHPQLPVLFITGFVADTQPLQALGRLLEKPFTREALLAAVASSIDGKLAIPH